MKVDVYDEKAFIDFYQIIIWKQTECECYRQTINKQITLNDTK